MFVKKTAKFGSWTNPNATATCTSLECCKSGNGSTFEAASGCSGTVNVSKGKKISLDDVVNVAVNKFQVVYEGSSMSETLNVPTKPIPVPPTSCCNSRKECFPVSICRAAVFARIIGLLNGVQNWREVVIEKLVEYLNEDIVPCFSDINAAGAELVACVTGSGSSVFYVNGQPTAAEQLLEDESISPVGLTAVEAYSLALSPFIAVGSTALNASGAIRLASLVDGVAALSCEVFGASVTPFDSAIFENYRQHRGQMNSAANLRSLLEGSQRVNNPSSKNTCALRVFAAIPQTVGPAVDAILVAARSIEIELNNGDAVFSDMGGAADSSQAILNVSIIASASQFIIESSKERLNALGCQCEPVSSTFTSFEGLDKLRRALAAELIASLSSLGAGADDEDDRKEVVAAVEAKVSKKPAAGQGKGKEVDMEGLSEAQRAKVEAKRKEKEEKAAKKAAQKELKKAGASGIISKPLGAGTELLKQALKALTQNRVSDLNALLEAMHPFNTSSTGLGARFRDILETCSSQGKRRPKIAKGARDFGPDQMKIREQAFAAIRKIFKRHGGVEIDTPVFELKEILTGKYGEDSKLIYDLADQGGELLSLRYDLTVPFARWLAMNSWGNIKRFHIAKVYRRDQPQPARGRYREFYQCDFDIAGAFSPMVPDAEVITVATEILSELPVGTFLIKLNHRRLLDAIFEICGVPTEKFRPICSAVDKLDKEPWSVVRTEMVEEKGLDPAAADRIGEFVQLRGPPLELLGSFLETKKFGDHAAANAALADLQLLFGYLQAMGSLVHVSFDLSLARGLDYYTGVIYEAVLTDGTSQLGSIAAGGRYDNLVGMFSASGQQTPCVGVSIGIERVFTIMERRAQEASAAQQSNIQVLVASVGPDMLKERMKLARILWSADISAEYSHQDNPKLKKQMDDALERAIPFMLVIGADELARGTVKIKNMRQHVELEVPINELVAQLLQQGCATIAAGADLTFMQALNAQRATELQGTA